MKNKKGKQGAETSLTIQIINSNDNTNFCSIHLLLDYKSSKRVLCVGSLFSL
jgi:hypothetical protein